MKQSYKDRHTVKNGGIGVFPNTYRKNESQIKIHYSSNDLKSNTERRTHGK